MKKYENQRTVFKTVRFDRTDDTNRGYPAVMQLGRLRGPNRLFGRVKMCHVSAVEKLLLHLGRLRGPTITRRVSDSNRGPQIRFSHLNQYDGFVMTLMMIFRVYIWTEWFFLEIWPGCLHVLAIACFHGVRRKFGCKMGFRSKDSIIVPADELQEPASGRAGERASGRAGGRASGRAGTDAGGAMLLTEGFLGWLSRFKLIRLRRISLATLPRYGRRGWFLYMYCLPPAGVLHSQNKVINAP